MTVNSNYSAYSSINSSSVSSSSQKGKPNFEDIAQQLLTSMDTDKSGSIDKAEFSAAAQALASNSNSSSTSSSSNSTKATDIFNTLDTNSDGSMSSEELVTALKNMKPPESSQGQTGNMPPPPPGGMPPPPPPSDSSSSSDSTSSSDTLSALDTNKDGTVSIDELLTSLKNSQTDSTSGTTSSSESSTVSSSQSTTSSQKLSETMLKTILSYYGNNDSSTTNTNATSLSISA